MSLCVVGCRWLSLGIHQDASVANIFSSMCFLPVFLLAAVSPVFLLVAMPTTLLLSECRSITVSLSDFPVVRAYSCSDGRYLFRLKQLWNNFRALGMLTPFGKWTTHWFQSLEQAGVPPCELIKSSTIPGYVTAYAVSVHAFAALLFQMFQARSSKCAIRAEAVRVLTVLDRFGHQCEESIFAKDLLVADVPVPLVFARGQGLTNFPEVIALFDERGFSGDEWASHAAEPRRGVSLQSAFECPALLDACLFGLCLRVRLRKTIQPVLECARDILASLATEFFRVTYPRSNDVDAIPK